jgi:NitT/TauT family transport system substrate-binding protein
MSAGKWIAGLVAAAFLSAAAHAENIKVKFVTDWMAQAEHGGFYQAVAKGYYAARGLDVEIVQGGPSVNVALSVGSGAAEFGIGSNAFIPLNAVREEVPLVAVAAMFQKDPQVLIAHPREDVKSVADMKGKPIMVSDATVAAFWVWLRAKYGFEDSQIRKYTFNLAPFINDPTAIQQGYVTSEPFMIERESGIKPQVFLLADEGYPGYANMIVANGDFAGSKPLVVAKFIEASIEGWNDYVYGDPAPANALIKAANPSMTDDVLSQAIDKMRSYKMLGETQADTGKMTEERWKAFFDVMSQNGVYDPGLDWRLGFTTVFLPQ